MAKSEDLKIFSPSVQGEDKHRHLMEELNRIVNFLFDDEATGKEVKIHEEK